MVRLGQVLAVAGTLASVVAGSGARPHRRGHDDRLRKLNDHHKRQGIGADGRLHRSEVEEEEEGVVHGAFTVELQDGVSVAELAAELSALDITIETRQTMDYKLFKGVSFSVVGTGDPDATEGVIASADGVKKLWPVRKVSAPPDEMKFRVDTNATAHSLDRRDLLERPYNPHVMTQIDRLHEAGFTGKGVRIAVIDTGVDYTHPLLGGCFGPGCLVTYGWDSIGVDRLDLQDPIVQPDDDPMDCNGHGTHVAGIVAAAPSDFGFMGVAPDAEIGAYRVLDCFAWGTEETIAMGMLRAFEDGSDMLTMSVGHRLRGSESLMSVIATRIIEAGVPVFVAVSNQGDGGSKFQISSPANGHLVSAVASFDPEEEPLVFLNAEYTVGGDDEDIAFGWVPHWWPAHDDDKILSLIDLNSFMYNNGSGNASRVTGCRPLPPSVPDLTDHLVLVEAIDSWECMGQRQLQHIYDRGGSNVMMWVPGEIPAQLWVSMDEVSNGVVVESMAKHWQQILAAGLNITVTITSPDKATASVVWGFNNETGGHVSEFSSWGPNWDLRVAPSFGAPGHNILSTLPGSLPGSVKGVGLSSGTSMSTPMVAGAAALLSQARGTLDPKTLHNLLGSTARQVAWNNNGVLRDGVTPVTHEGSGLIQLWDAAQAKGLLSSSSISFNDSDHHAGEVTFTLLNTGGKEATYKLGHSAALTTYALDPEGYLESNVPFEITRATANIAFEADEVTVAAGAEVGITVRCTAPEANKSRWPMYSGYITLNGTNGDNLAVSYVGNAGSMRDAQILRNDRNGWQSAWLSQGGWDVGLPVEADTVFTVPKPSGDRPADFDIYEDEVPVVIAYPEFSTRILRYDLVASHSNATTRCALPHEDWLGYETYGEIWGGRDANTNIHTEYLKVFVGYLANGTPVPPGRYSILVSALRLLSAGRNDIEDWQVIETVPFILQYES